MIRGGKKKEPAFFFPLFFLTKKRFTYSSSLFGSQAILLHQILCMTDLVITFAGRWISSYPSLFCFLSFLFSLIPLPLSFPFLFSPSPSTNKEHENSFMLQGCIVLDSRSIHISCAVSHASSTSSIYVNRVLFNSCLWHIFCILPLIFHFLSPSFL